MKKLHGEPPKHEESTQRGTRTSGIYTEASDQKLHSHCPEQKLHKEAPEPKESEATQGAQIRGNLHRESPKQKLQREGPRT